MKVILVGNPNVGKSVIFSRLTGTKVITSNFPGTTVGITRGTLQCSHRKCDQHAYPLIDVPGIYGLDSLAQDAEKVAARIVNQPGLLVNVIDATHLERNLYLTLQLLQDRNRSIIVVLNLWDEALYHGIHIDIQKLEELLGVPVLTSVALTGVGIRALLDKIVYLQDNHPAAQENTTIPQAAVPASWEQIHHMVAQVQTVTERKKKLGEYLETITLSPLWGSLIAIGVLLSSFVLVSCVGDRLERLIAYFLNFTLTPLLLTLHAWLTHFPFLQQLLVGNVQGNAINYAEAMGMLTSGIYIPLAKVAPVVAIFYVLIGFLEDCGYLPRLAILSDTLMHRFALHGFAIVPMVLGAGCNVTGIVATRILPTTRQRVIASLLLR